MFSTSAPAEGLMERISLRRHCVYRRSASARSIEVSDRRTLGRTDGRTKPMRFSGTGGRKDRRRASERGRQVAGHTAVLGGESDPGELFSQSLALEVTV